MRHCLPWRISACLAPYLEEKGHGVIAKPGEFQCFFAGHFRNAKHPDSFRTLRRFWMPFTTAIWKTAMTADKFGTPPHLAPVVRKSNLFVLPQPLATPIVRRQTEQLAKDEKQFLTCRMAPDYIGYDHSDHKSRPQCGQNPKSLRRQLRITLR